MAGKYSNGSIARKVRKRAANHKSRAYEEIHSHIPVEAMVAWLSRNLKMVPKHLQHRTAELFLEHIRHSGDALFKHLFTIDGQMHLLIGEQDCDAQWWLYTLVRHKGHELADTYYKSDEEWTKHMKALRAGRGRP